MNVKKCANGHFFDSDKFAACPHCGAGLSPDLPPDLPPENPQSSGSSLLRFLKKRRTERTDTDPSSPPPPPEPSAQPRELPDYDSVHDGTTISLPVSSAQSAQCPYCRKQNRAAAKYCIYCGSSLRASAASVPAMGEPETYAASSQLGAEISSAEQPAAPAFADIQEEPTPEPEREAAAQSLQDAVFDSIDEDDKTIGFYSLRKPEPQSSRTDPVVGWLVCVKGAHWGESFPIAAGRNSVGRSASNKIVLKKDNTVSREKHAWVTFDPKTVSFYVQPGESSGMSYLNGEGIFEAKKLAASDRMEFGNGTYILVPLCSEHFSWESYI